MRVAFTYPAHEAYRKEWPWLVTSSCRTSWSFSRHQLRYVRLKKARQAVQKSRIKGVRCVITVVQYRVQVFMQCSQVLSPLVKRLHVRREVTRGTRDETVNATAPIKLSCRKDYHRHRQMCAETTATPDYAHTYTATDKEISGIKTSWMHMCASFLDLTPLSIFTPLSRSHQAFKASHRK